MSKSNKKPASQGNKVQEPAHKTGTSRPWIIAAGIAVAVIVALVALNGGGDKSASTSPEYDYTGRFLPVAYESPQIADAALYAAAVPMTQIDATQDEQGFAVSLDSVVSNKIVRFDYTRPTGETLPMIAYVRPSGKLFVGVSYCPPCEGEGQRIEADGTLTCDSCGTRRNLEDNTGLSGACKLYPLDEIPSTVDGDRILVDSGVLDSWTAQPLDRPIG